MYMGISCSLVPSTLGGPVTAYAVTLGQMPLFLILDGITCQISGYTLRAECTKVEITARNSGGVSRVTLQLEIQRVRISFVSSSLILTRGTTMNDTTSTVVPAGAVLSYAISPTLPEGLQLNPTSGVVSGTPTLSSGYGISEGYNVTAWNSYACLAWATCFCNCH